MLDPLSLFLQLSSEVHTVHDILYISELYHSNECQLLMKPVFYKFYETDIFIPAFLGFFLKYLFEFQVLLQKLSSY